MREKRYIAFALAVLLFVLAELNNWNGGSISWSEFESGNVLSADC